MLLIPKDEITPTRRRECQLQLLNDCLEENTSSTGWKYSSEMVSEKYNHRQVGKIFFSSKVRGKITFYRIFRKVITITQNNNNPKRNLCFLFTLPPIYTGHDSLVHISLYKCQTII